MKKRQRRQKRNSLDIPSSIWLKKNGLHARKLTIMHILNPTMVKVQPNFIPMLTSDAVVQVLLNSPSTHKYPFQVFNLANVDLKSYEEKLQSSIAEYKHRLDMIVWRNLNQEERDKFTDSPACYLSNQDSLNQALDRLGWPVSPKQLQFMIDEIYQGQMYLKQCREIQKPMQKTFIKLNEVLSPRKVEKKVKLGVIARDDSNGFYYDGEVEGRAGQTKYSIILENRKRVKVLQKHCYLQEDIGSAVLKIGDYVLAYQKSMQCYLPGMIIGAPRVAKLSDALYCVLLFNQLKVFVERDDLIEVDDENYEESVEFIRSLQPNYDISSDETGAQESPTEEETSKQDDRKAVDLLISDVLKTGTHSKRKPLKKTKSATKILITKDDIQQIQQKIEFVEKQMEASAQEMGLQRKAIKLQSTLLLNLMDGLKKAK